MGPSTRGDSGAGSEARSRGGRRVRAQGSVLGLTLVFALLIVGSVVIVAFGASAINDSQETLSVERAEKAMTQFDSRAALVALGNTDIQQVDFGVNTAAEFNLDRDAGFMRVSKTNLTSGDTSRLIQADMGAVIYEVGDTSIAYQGGGVWRNDGNESLSVSPPEFHFRNGTLTLPIVSVAGDAALNNRVSISHNETLKEYPVTSSSDRLNPLTNHKVVVTVKSDYYRAWGDYFETRTDGEVAYDHANNIANLTLVSPINARRITSATASLSASGTFKITGAGKSACNGDYYTDSYNSSGTNAGYCGQSIGDNGDIVYGRDVDIDQGSGGHYIRGDVVSGQDVYVSSSAGGGQPYVHGHINYTDNCYGDCSGRIVGPSGSPNQIGGVETAPAINSYIESTVQDAESDNDNASPQISGDELNYGATDTRTLDAGRYYLEEIDLDADETLELNTTGGEVTIAVEEDMDLAGGGSGGGTIRILGDGVAKIYVNGTGVSGDHLYIGKNAGIVNNGDDAPQFRLYGKDNFEAYIDGQGSGLAKFVGVIYAPPGDLGTGRVDIDGGEVYGGILTGTTTLDDGSIHYDEALQEQTVISRDAKIVKVTYLHISVNRIDIAGA